jgi:hypothetical protein
MSMGRGALSLNVVLGVSAHWIQSSARRRKPTAMA